MEDSGSRTYVERLRAVTPGVLLLLVVAGLSVWLATFLPAYIGGVFVAVVLGILIANIVRPDMAVYGPGVKLGLKQFLKAAIVLLGAGISFQEIRSFGGEGLLVILILIVAVFVVAISLGRLLGVALRRVLLIAVGVSICGNTAVATTAPLIDADEDEVAMAVGIVTLFGVLSVLIYPLIGTFLEMSDLIFGVWAGTAINDTSQVVAAGFIYSEEAGKIATTIKLTRNVMIVPVVLGVAYFYRRRVQTETGRRVKVREIFPTFVLGFLALAAVNSFGLLPELVQEWLLATSRFLILVALSGIGLSVNLKKLRGIGLKPFGLGFVVELLLAVGALLLIMLVFGVL